MSDSEHQCDCAGEIGGALDQPNPHLNSLHNTQTSAGACFEKVYGQESVDKDYADWESCRGGLSKLHPVV